MIHELLAEASRSDPLVIPLTILSIATGIAWLAIALDVILGVRRGRRGSLNRGHTGGAAAAGNQEPQPTQKAEATQNAQRSRRQAGWEALGLDAAVAAEAAQRLREAIRRGDVRVALVRDDCPGEMVLDLSTMELRCLGEEGLTGGEERVVDLEGGGEG